MMRVVILAAALVWLAACTSLAPLDRPDALKVFIAESGVYRLTRDDLRAKGFALAERDLSRLHLTHKGVEIPLDVELRGGDFVIFFYAAPDANLYSLSDVYWLSLADGAGARMDTRAVEVAHAGPVAETFTTTVRLEENRLYSASAYGDSHWFWQTFTAPATRTLTTTLAAVGASEAQLRVRLAGSSDGPHRVEVLLNDQVAGEARWNGQGAQVYMATISNLLSGENRIALRAPGEPDQAEVNLLDEVTLTYQRTFTAADGLLEFGGAQNYRIRGFPAEQPMLYDISYAAHAQKLTGFQTTRADDATTISFFDSLPDRRYIALVPSAAKAPLKIRAARANTLRAPNPHADYLIITPSAFADVLQPLVKHRAARGLMIKLVDVEQVYDAFSHGVSDPHAIRDFLTYVREGWGAPTPRFVLLVGKASYDDHDYLKGPNKNLLPTFLVPTPHLGEAASDNWFVASDRDAHPTIAIGRIPAKTPEQLRVTVDKIIAYESRSGQQAWQRRAVFVADDKDTAFTATSDALSQRLPDALRAEKIYLSDYRGDLNAARAQLMREWNAGAALLTYIGHGSLDTWAAGPLFGAEHLNEIKNVDRLPILLTPTCLDGFFYHPQKDSLAENLLFKPDGGMIAGLVPTGLSLPEAQDALMRALFAELFEQAAPTLGEAITRAKQQLSPDTPDLREVIETFVLLGDPALPNPFRQP